MAKEVSQNAALPSFRNGTRHEKGNTRNPSQHGFIAPAMQIAFVRSMHIPQLLSLSGTPSHHIHNTTKPLSRPRKIQISGNKMLHLPRGPDSLRSPQTDSLKSPPQETHLEHHFSIHLGHHRLHFCERVVTGGHSLRSSNQTYYTPLGLDMGTWGLGDRGGHGDMGFS